MQKRKLLQYAAALVWMGEYGMSSMVDFEKSED